MPLVNYYSGDAAWKNLVAIHKREPLGDAPKAELIEALGGCEDLATVIASITIEPTEWIIKAVPALDGLTAIECIKTPKGMQRLRECLLRFPI